MIISFKPHSREEIPLRVKWLNNREANKYAIENPEHETTTEEQTVWYDRYEQNPYKKFFTIFDDEKPIGFMGLSDIDKEAVAFIMIGEDDYRGKGIGKISLKYLIDYGFKELGLKRMTASTDPRNEPVIKLNKSVGFREISRDERDISWEITK
ncbi:TPA: hypothetical protein DDZ75_04365 [Patescibacteria group bacterium]|nr:hypothetical protein [Patescibacteria group bacterium]